MSRIGFIGLGNMGGPMVRNLLAAGHTVSAFDLVPRAIDDARAAGAEAAPSAAAAASAVDVAITMLPTGRDVRAVYLGEGGVFAAADAGTLLIDSSTIDVTTAREVGATAEARGLDMIDAPVSGGVAGAEAASLTFMVGGSEPAVGRARPVLEAMGKTIVHAGAAGTGQAAKICNNLIPPANRDYAPGFTAAMMLKDLRLAQEAAQTADAATPLGAEAAALYALFAAAGNGAKDFSGIITMLRGAA